MSRLRQSMHLITQTMSVSIRKRKKNRRKFWSWVTSAVRIGAPLFNIFPAHPSLATSIQHSAKSTYPRYSNPAVSSFPELSVLKTSGPANESLPASTINILKEKANGGIVTRRTCIGRVEKTDPRSADYPLTPTPQTTLLTTPRTNQSTLRTTPTNYPE